MLSFQNLQPNKHDVEDGMCTVMKKKRRGKRILLILEECLHLFLSTAPPAIPLLTVLNVLLK